MSEVSLPESTSEKRTARKALGQVTGNAEQNGSCIVDENMTGSKQKGRGTSKSARKGGRSKENVEEVVSSGGQEEEVESDGTGGEYMTAEAVMVAELPDSEVVTGVVSEEEGDEEIVTGEDVEHAPGGQVNATSNTPISRTEDHDGKLHASVVNSS